MGQKELKKFRIHESVFRAEGSRILRKVSIGEKSSVWFNAVVRGDEGAVRIGKRTNVQDSVIIHSGDNHAVEIGDDVTIGHGASSSVAIVVNDAMATIVTAVTAVMVIVVMVASESVAREVSLGVVRMATVVLTPCAVVVRMATAV